MSKLVFTKKSLIFKIIYLIFSFAVEAYTIYLLISSIVMGFASGASFDDVVIMFATVFAALFEGSMIGFIIRSFKAPTLLMKTLVFKFDGTPYIVGIVGVVCGAVVTLALAVLFFISAYGKSIIDIPFTAQCFIADVSTILGVNLSFVFAYFLTFKHESGSFAII